MSEGNITVLIAALRSRFLGKRINAAKALGERRDTQAVPALVEVLQDKTDLAWRAAEALGAIGDPQAVPALLQASLPPAFKSGMTYKEIQRNSRLRGSAVVALGMIGDPEVVPFLIEALKDRDTAWEAAGALARIGLPSAPALIDVLKNEDAIQDKDLSQRQRDHALRALLAIRDPKVAPSLITALGIEGLSIDDGREMTKALVKMGIPVVPAIIEAFQNKNEHRSVRLRMAHAIAWIRDARAVPFLIQALKDRDGDQMVSCKAAQTLKRMAQHHPCLTLRSALPTLRRLRKRNFIYQEAEEQIKAATAAFKDLPLPAAAPPPDAKTLSRPADMPLSDLVTPPQGWWMRLCRGLEGS